MATVTGMTAAAMQAIADGVVVSGAVNNDGYLILTKFDGSTVNAGYVKGAAATALLTAVDTASIDLTLAGAGTPASPWVLSADRKRPIEIGANVNLNTLMTTANYVQSESAEATLALNYPIAERGFLEIMDNGNDQILQKYTTTGDPEASAFSGGVEYTRVHHWWGAWRPWRRSSDLLTRGTTTERNAIFGVPTTDAQRVALANQRIAWFNTSLGWWESYYATVGTTGLTVKGLKTGHSSGWYPMAGSPLSVHRGRTAGFESIPAGGTLYPTLAAMQDHHGGFTSSGTSGVLVPYGGYYRVTGHGYFSGAPSDSITTAIRDEGDSTLFSAIGTKPNGDDFTSSAQATIERVSGMGIKLSLSVSAVTNCWGTNAYNGTRLTVEYVRPPLVD